MHENLTEITESCSACHSQTFQWFYHFHLFTVCYPGWVSPEMFGGTQLTLSWEMKGISKLSATRCHSGLCSAKVRKSQSKQSRAWMSLRGTNWNYLAPSALKDRAGVYWNEVDVQRQTLQIVQIVAWHTAADSLDDSLWLPFISLCISMFAWIIYVLIVESDSGMTAFMVIHFQGLCQQSLLVLFSKTPRALSLIQPFSAGKYHGNGVGKSWPRLSQQTHTHKTQTHTAAAARVPHQSWAIDISPMASGPH